MLAFLTFSSFLCIPWGFSSSSSYSLYPQGIKEMINGWHIHSTTTQNTQNLCPKRTRTSSIHTPKFCSTVKSKNIKLLWEQSRQALPIITLGVTYSWEHWMVIKTQLHRIQVAERAVEIELISSFRLEQTFKRLCSHSPTSLCCWFKLCEFLWQRAIVSTMVSSTSFNEGSSLVSRVRKIVNITQGYNTDNLKASVKNETFFSLHIFRFKWYNHI